MDQLLPADLVAKAREVIDYNRKAGRRIAVAESCTGGLVSAALTEIPGSSEVFEAGYVTYSNAAKISELNVALDVVETFGAVSVATAWAMAQGALEASGADVAVAITGIAGPTGGTAKKPVGTVHIAVANLHEAQHRHYQFMGSRDIVKKFATNAAFDMLRLMMISHPV